MADLSRFDVLEVTVGAEVVSFRNPLFAAVTHTLPCPPPSTVAGMLGAARGGVGKLPRPTRFAYAFSAQGQGVDLETFHPVDGSGRAKGYGQKGGPRPVERPFLYGCVLRLWLPDDLAGWERALRVPVWPLTLGRSQDLIDAPRLRRAALSLGGSGRLGDTVAPAAALDGAPPPGVRRIRMPAEVSTDRQRTRWAEYLYAGGGGQSEVACGSHPGTETAVTDDGQVVVFHEWDGRLG